MSENVNSEIPDSIRPFLNEIADRIWAERAAVLVGAGFSKNAGSGFPDWNQLGDLFYQKAHGKKPEPTKQKFLNVLQLAEEVQATIGRPALENLLRSSIPDLAVEPSDLHIRLLDLPWADIFTTNYDTLLERASSNIVTRRYEPVINKEDIPYSIKPRIVKLHGSFPSERPFIITEEDYRRYPYDYAPFVNTVQQALLENTFCLIGFSGDDPNFLQWIGWIRDNLGNNKTQKIYLIGVFNLSSAKLKLLSERGITVVDLSKFPNIDEQDHKQAFNKFFEFLESKKPDALNWPKNKSKMSPAIADDSTSDRNEVIQEVTEIWKKQRSSYPGWLTLPQNNRENLWIFTQSWLNFLPDLENVPPGLDIIYGYELIWRLEKCLLPVFSDIAVFYENLLEKYWPFPISDNSSSFKYKYGESEKGELAWMEIREAWLNIALAMLRFHREEGHIKKWEKIRAQISTISKYLSEDQKEFINHESYLFKLFNLDLPGAKQCLEEWRPNNSHPYWVAKRSAALAEMGQLNEANTIIKIALENIREKLNQQSDAYDLGLVSREGYAMFLARFIQGAAKTQENNYSDLEDKNAQFNDRWNQLKAYKCDPWNELKLFELMLDGKFHQKNNISEKHEYDIGRITQTHHWNNTDNNQLHAYSFLRFCEEVGLPFRIGNYTLATKTGKATLKSISRDSPFWATSTLFRLGDVKAVDSLFSRESVYRFTTNEADRLIHNYLSALKNCKDEIQVGDNFRKNNFGILLAQLLPEIISRLCSKCSLETKYELLEFVSELYSLPEKIKYRKVNNLIKRLLESISKSVQYNLIPKLLEISFPGNLSHLDKKEFLNPFLYLEIDKKPNLNIEEPNIDSDLVDELLKNAESTDVDYRHWAITTLVKLYKLELLNSTQTKKLGVSIWSKTDEFGLPKNTDFYKFVFLELPHPKDIDPSKRFKKFIKNTPFPVQKNSSQNSISITRGNIPIVHEIIGANKNDESFWTKTEAKEILKRLIRWWDADKDRLKEKDSGINLFSSVPEEFQSRFARLIKILSNVVAPKLTESISKEVKTELNRLLREMNEYNLSILYAKAACIHIFPKTRSDIFHQINSTLVSNNSKTINDGLKALETIVVSDIYTEKMSKRNDLLLSLSQYITWSNTESIAQALRIVLRILKDKPNIFNNNLEKATQNCLSRLLIETDYKNHDSSITFDKKLMIRRVAANLASKLCLHYNSNHLPIPNIIGRWYESCLSPDEFSEIRNLWEDCELN